ncbi:hypothetical protein DICPUDRAFT_74353 [Dictyostelium purpureum]|uniref:Uncharacterized protein n=1 Tax=Dictyostelium purpureum TaxID=5786 RepID=F0Z7H4_DICPU|nr:uncharacterized protein DICPUDRAFT_74353 [Dictyostelium purpureum]EGC40178.1 hypothetical protein DICPUDRAFT_74353 [Dictyostelium purpureum]|eukprot:XP_003283368.1 hypothetical protein DICPUDRAFT_74353 [Dictyostelium purpureum]
MDILNIKKKIKNELLSIFFYEKIEHYKTCNIVVQIEDLEYSKNKRVKSVLFIDVTSKETLRKKSIIIINYLQYITNGNNCKLYIECFSELALLDTSIILHLIPHPCIKYKKIVDNKEIFHYQEDYKTSTKADYLKRKNIDDILNNNNNNKNKKKIKTTKDDLAKIDNNNCINNTDNNNCNNSNNNINDNNDKNSSNNIIIKETKPFKLIIKNNQSTKPITNYLIKVYNELYNQKGDTGLINLFSRLLNYFKYVDSSLINQKIDNYLISNNNNNKIFKLLSIYIFSHLNYFVKKTNSDIKDIKKIYESVLIKINNREHIKSIHSFYKRINNKNKYYSINSDISDYLKFIDYSVEIEIRKINFYNYQLQYSTKPILNENNKNTKTINNSFKNIKNNINNNNTYNNNIKYPYNSEELVKVYDQEVFTYNFYLKPDLYCNKNIFKSDFGNNPEELKYERTILKNNIFYEPPQNGNYSISPSLELFKLCFSVFSSGLFKNFDWGEESDETRVIISGGSISACLDTLPISIKKEFVNYKTIERYLYKSKMPVLLVRKFMELVFESSLLKELLFERFFGKSSPNHESDIDVWFISQDLNSAKKKLFQAIEIIKSNFREANPLFENSFTFVRSPNAITFIGTYPFRKIQFIIKIYKSVDHLLSAFDMDCVKVFYDGSNVFMHKESIDSYNKRYNIAYSLFIRSNKLRINKYLDRGFITFSNIENVDYCTSSSQDSFPFNIKSPKKVFDFEEMESLLTDKFGREEVSKDQYYLLENPSSYTEFYQGISFKEKFEISPKISIECKACRRYLKYFYKNNYKKFCAPKGNRCSMFFKILPISTFCLKVISRLKYSLVLGGRTGLGFRLAFYLLELGFTVIITSRFPEITKKKFSQEQFTCYLPRLHIVKVDFNDTVQTEKFIKYIIVTIPKLDFLFNTIKFSNKNINNNYSSIFNQLKTQEESLKINNNNNNNDKNDNNNNNDNNDDGIDDDNIDYGESFYYPDQHNKPQFKIINISNKNIYKYDTKTDKSIFTTSKFTTSTATSTTNQIINNSMVLTNEYINYIHYKLPKLIISQLISIIENQKLINEYFYKSKKIVRNVLGEYIHEIFSGTGVIFNINWKEGDEIDKIIILHNKNINNNIYKINYKVYENFEKKEGNTNSLEYDIHYLKYLVRDKDDKKCYIKRKENQLLLKSKGSTENICFEILKQVFKNYFTFTNWTYEY